MAENCYLYFDSFTVRLQNLQEFKDLIKKGVTTLQSTARLFIIESNQVCGVSPSGTVAHRDRPIIEVKEPAYLRRGASLKLIASQIAEVNKFEMGDLGFGIEESRLEAGAAVDLRFLICGIVETRDQ